MKYQNSWLPLFLCYLIVIPCVLFVFAAAKPQNFLPRGASLSVGDDEDVLTSPDNTFTCGLFGSSGGNAYWLSIWFTNSKDRTVVWTANRDRPVNGRGSRVSLRRDGNMVLTDVDGSMVWETLTSNNVSRAELLDSGNLVIKDFKGNIVWQSFDFPTDTLLPYQLFKKSTKLVSKLSIGNFASGYFNFFYDDNNVLTLLYDGPEISSIYWPRLGFSVFENGRTNYNSSRVASFDEMGNFLSSDLLQFSASDMGFGIRRRLTMDTDGNLRLYSLNNATGLWVVSWEGLLKQCDVHGVCGRYGICVNTPEPKCSCPPGYEATEPGNWNKGCKPKFTKTCSQSLEEVKFVEVMQVDYYGYDLNFSMSISQEDCMKLCLYDCRCEAYSYRLTGEGRCYTKSALFNGFMSPNFPGSMYLKLPMNVQTSEPTFLNGTEPICGSSGSKILIGSPTMYDTIGKKVKWVYLYSFAGAIGAMEFLVILSGWLLFGRHGIPASVEDGYRAIESQFKRFSYAELKKATKNFKEELGRGASGAVYKGILADERVVAVKRLEDSSYQGGDEFWAEVSTIGKIYHMNLVRMWGFCSEQRRRLLVYEYMEHQSLDKHLFSPKFLGWKKRFKVALGAAKGLAYLHHECLEWVIHCDVKPENILLDSDFEPKIADFGLAKLSQRGSNSSEFSRIRGTKGYMAPEWALNHPITAKVDVYSYGVVVLELVKGIRLSNWITRDDKEQESELTRFVRITKMKIQGEDNSWIDETVDPRLNGQFKREQVVAVVKVGIACVSEDRSQRPTMDSVVQSLLECLDEAKIHFPDNQ